MAKLETYREAQLSSDESFTLIDAREERLTDALEEAWKYRELLHFLVWRDLKIRYKQSVVGVAWVILQPVLTMTLFSVIFGYLIGVDTSGTPYPVFVLTGLVAWQLFAYSLSQGGTSLVVHQRLITRIYFPRLFIPMSPVIAALVDFALASLVLSGFLVYYGIVPMIAFVTIPLFVLMLVVVALGAAFWISALNVEYRDVQYMLPFLTQLWFFATPIIYSSTVVPGHWQLVLGLNPMSGVVEGLRWALFGEPTGVGSLVLVSALVAITLFISGVAYFRRMERTFADIV